MTLCIICAVACTEPAEELDADERQSIVSRLQYIGCLPDGVRDDQRGVHLTCIQRVNKALLECQRRDAERRKKSQESGP